MAITHESDPLEFDNQDFDKLEQEIADIDGLGVIKISAEEGLSEALEQMKRLENQLNDGEAATLIEACKASVMDSITSQFGLASVFIITKDGGNVTTAHNFRKGITASEQDQQKFNEYVHNNDGSKKWSDVRKEVGYDGPLSKKRKDAFKNRNIIYDEYTGKPLPKDGRTHLDHIVSAKEIESNSLAHLTLSPEQRAKLATDEANLAFTAAEVNQSKGEKRMADWLELPDEKSGITKAERFNVDKQKALGKLRISPAI